MVDPNSKHSVSFVRHVLRTTRQAQKSQVPPRRQTATVCSISGRRQVHIAGSTFVLFFGEIREKFIVFFLD